MTSPTKTDGESGLWTYTYGTEDDGTADDSPDICGEAASRNISGKLHQVPMEQETREGGGSGGGIEDLGSCDSGGELPGVSREESPTPAATGRKPDLGGALEISDDEDEADAIQEENIRRLSEMTVAPGKGDPEPSPPASPHPPRRPRLAAEKDPAAAVNAKANLDTPGDASGDDSELWGLPEEPEETELRGDNDDIVHVPTESPSSSSRIKDLSRQHHQQQQQRRRQQRERRQQQEEEEGKEEPEILVSDDYDEEGEDAEDRRAAERGAKPSIV